MATKIREDQWVYVVVQDPEKNPQYLGQHDEEKNISFIPTFLEKDHAVQSLNHLKRDTAKKYEVQAVLYEELCRDAEKSGFYLFLLDENGKLMEWVEP
jgi:hypothetical protein